MKKLLFIFVISLLAMVHTSCNKGNHYTGQYHTVYVSPASDMPHIDINLDIKEISDTLHAKMAVYHYYKKNLLFSEVTEDCVPVINKDTILLNFVLTEDEEIDETELEERYLNVKLLCEKDSLKLLSSSDDKILPDDFLTFHKAVTHEDSAAICFDRRMPRITMVSGLHLINGPVKKIRDLSKYGFEYTFDEKGMMTSYTNSDGDVYNYEISEDGDGGYISTQKYRGSVVEQYEYNYLYQMVGCVGYGADNSFLYDHCGRLEGYFSESQKWDRYYELERDARGVLTAIRCSEDSDSDVLFKVLKVDDYGNPLEQRLRFNYMVEGYYDDAKQYKYEYY